MNTQNTRTYLGLMGVMQSEITGYSQNSYVTVVLSNAEQRAIQLDTLQYQAMQDSLNRLTVTPEEWIYLWVEVDDQDNLLNWSLLTAPYPLEYLAKLYQFSHHPEDFIGLIHLINSLTNLHLKSFLWALFSKETLATKFVSVQGSKQHHHAFPGGLLNHSLECARITRNALYAIADYPKTELELAVTSALLHDIGKVQTHNYDGNLTQEGYSVPHEAYTLKQLTPEIEQLKSQNLQLGIALEYLLTWKDGKGFPRLESANIIKAADRTSTAYDLKKQAFAGKPDYYHFAPLNSANLNHVIQRLN
jgi:putative nucleotidyltransferase with HDIG domain